MYRDGAGFKILWSISIEGLRRRKLVHKTICHIATAIRYTHCLLMPKLSQHTLSGEGTILGSRLGGPSAAVIEIA